MLTQKQIDHARPRGKAYKLFDERGMYLLVAPEGGRWWRFAYRFQGKRKQISLGVYPDVTLKRAREKRDEARTLVADGKDPSRERQKAKLSSSVTLDVIANEWLQVHGAQLAEIT
jgi:hypothetical protein